MDNLISSNETIIPNNDINHELINNVPNESILLSSDETMTKNSFINFFKSHIIDPIYKSLNGLIKSNIESIKKKYADSIILDSNGNILLLQRASDSTFPNEWCLPGGHVDDGEIFLDAAERELKEETSLSSDLQFVCKSEKSDCIIQYFFGRTDLNPIITIDKKEHQNYAWVNLNELDQYTLILDLSKQLKEIFDITSDSPLQIKIETNDFNDIEELTFEKAWIEIVKSYNEGLITDEIYFNALKKYQLVQQYFLPLDEQFEKGFITEKMLFDRIFKAKDNIASKEIEEDPTEDAQQNDDIDDSQNESADPDQVHGKTGMNYDKLRQLAMTTPQAQLENFIKHSKDPELRKIAHDELARRLDDEHPQEDEDNDSKQDNKNDSKGKSDKKPTNAKEALESNNQSPEGDIQDDPEYHEKAAQYAKAVTSGQDPSTNPFLADFANHIEEKKKDHKDLQFTVEMPGDSNNEADENLPNTEGENEKVIDDKKPVSKKDDK